MGIARSVVLGWVLAGGAGACSQYGSRPKSPAHGGAAWVEAASPHFRVVTDLPVEDAEATASELERGLSALAEVEFAHERTPVAPTNVIVFSSASDFHAFYPELVQGQFSRSLPGDLEPGRFVMLYGGLSEETRITCLHELSHDLFERNFGPAPAWLNEGFAQYFSTVRVEADRIRVGAALPNVTFTLELDEARRVRAVDGSLVVAIPVDQVATPSQLLGLDRSAFYRAASAGQPSEAERLRAASLYLGSWAFMHMLHDGPEPYPTRFKQFLEKVKDAQVQDAWQSAFAGLNPADLDHDFKKYLARGELAIFEYRRRHPEVVTVIKKRALSDAEVHVLWARLTPPSGALSQAARLDLDEAVSETGSAEAHYFRGLYWLHRRQLAAAEADLVNAARLAPSDSRYALGVLALRIEQSPAAEHVHAGDPIMQAAAPLVRVADSAFQLRTLALIYDDVGEPEQALALAERAVALAPIDSFCLDTEARVLSHLGRVGEALSLERSAVAFLPESAAAPQILQRLREYEALARAAH